MHVQSTQGGKDCAFATVFFLFNYHPLSHRQPQSVFRGKRRYLFSRSRADSRTPSSEGKRRYFFSSSRADTLHIITPPDTQPAALRLQKKKALDSITPPPSLSRRQPAALRLQRKKVTSASATCSPAPRPTRWTRQRRQTAALRLQRRQPATCRGPQPRRWTRQRRQTAALRLQRKKAQLVLQLQGRQPHCVFRGAS